MTVTVRGWAGGGTGGNSDAQNCFSSLVSRNSCLRTDSTCCCNLATRQCSRRRNNVVGGTALCFALRHAGRCCQGGCCRQYVSASVHASCMRQTCQYQDTPTRRFPVRPTTTAAATRSRADGRRFEKTRRRSPGSRGRGHMHPSIVGDANEVRTDASRR